MFARSHASDGQIRTDAGFLWSRPWVVAFPIYVLLTAVWFRAILGNPGGALPLGEEATETAWRLWWVRKAILDLGHLPYRCEYVNYPQGLSLFLYDLMPLYGVLALPWTWATSSPERFIAASNAISLLILPVSASLACALCYRATRSFAGSIVGGFAFGLAPMRVAELDSLNVSNGLFVPSLLLLAAWPESTRTAGRALLVGCCLVGAFLTSYTELALALFCVPFIAGWRIALASRRRDAAAGEARFWLSALLPLACLLGVLLIMTPGRNLDASLFVEPPPSRSEAHSATFSMLFSSRQRIWSHGARGVHTATMDKSYLGFTLPLLALLGLLRGRVPEIGKLATLGGLAFVLSLGTRLSIGGAWIPLPFGLFRLLGPPFSFFRTPYRFLFLACLVLAVLLAAGVAECVRLARNRGGPARRCLLGLTSAAVLALVVEYWPAHFETAAVKIPRALLEARSQSTGSGSVLILPAKTYGDRAKQRLCQIALDRPLPIAPIPRVDRLATEPYRTSALFRMLADEQEDARLLGHDLSELGRSGVSCLIVVRSQFEPRPILDAWLERHGDARIFDSDTLSIYKISGRP